MAMTNQQQTEAYQFFVIAFGAAPGVEYMTQISDAYNAGLTTQQIVNIYTTKAQFTSTYPTFFTSEQFAAALINNVVGSSASAAAKAEAQADIVGALNAGWSRGDVVYQIFTNLAAKDPADPMWGATSTLLANKVAVAKYVTEVQLNGSTDVSVLQGVLAGVTATSDVSTPAKIKAIIGGASGGNNSLTVVLDNIFGTTEGQTYKAPIVQNQNGAVTNTLESGDVIAAVGTGNTLKADLTLTISGTQTQGPAISAATNNIQVVELRAQTGNNDDAGGNGMAPHGNKSHIDAENFNGVQQWWTTDSRASIQIEDVRTRPEDTTIGMRNTDPEVGFRVYFDPEQLTNNSRTKDSALTLTLDNILKPGDLTEVPVDGVSFKLDGVLHALKSEAIGNAKTHAELLTALQAAIAADPALAGVTAKLNANNTITIADPAGKAFTPGAWAFIDGVVPADGNIVFQQKVGNPVLVNQLITTNVELDNVGRTSTGGILDIGSLGDGGVQKFDVNVDRSSALTKMQSSEHLNHLNASGLQKQFLEEVALHNKGANGNLKVGSKTDFADGRLANGLTDVRVVDGSAFKGNLNLGIKLEDGANGAYGRYLAKSTKAVEFNYTGGQGNDLFNVDVASGVSGARDYVLNINTGAGDDRLVLKVAASTVPNGVPPGSSSRLNTTSVDGGTGTNTIVMNADVGMRTDGYDTFKSFKNFQNYEVEGGNHNFTNLTGVKSVIVATTGTANTTLRNLPADLSTVSVSGKNQTATPATANSAQTFGTLTVEAAKSAALTVNLDNTAGVDGKLSLDTLLVKAENATNLSAVRTVNIVSNGTRDTTNLLGTQAAATDPVTNGIRAEGVNTINFSGAQALTARIEAAANSTSVATPAKVDNLKVDGAAMTGALNLWLNGTVATNVDNGAKKTISVTGGASAKDVLTFGEAVTTTARTTVSGFETVDFKAAATVDATNFSGVTLYKSAGAGAIKLTNLKSTENFELAIDSANAISLQTLATGGALNAAFKNGANNTPQEFSTSGFTTLNLKLDVKATDAAANKAFSFNLSKVGLDGTGAATVATGTNVADANYFGKAALTNIVVTGGAGTVTDNTANLGTLSAVVKSVDVSGYMGTVTATIGNALVTTVGTPVITTGNTTVKVGAYGINFTDMDHAAAPSVDSVTAFVFTTDAYKDATAGVQKWVISEFQGIKAHVANAGFISAADAGGTLSDLTVLDLSALGIKGLQDMVITETQGATADTNVVTIKSGLAQNFVIELAGVYKDQLDLANFKFAV